ncbi:MAG: hypothetical protein HBSIN02_17430 [Bacteroidia bacterium]|nr:MAG: hypothetical protein HBSIN02_17430 [Bacteroidia bacterium]
MHGGLVGGVLLAIQEIDNGGAAVRGRSRKEAVEWMEGFILIGRAVEQDTNA